MGRNLIEEELFAQRRDLFSQMVAGLVLDRDGSPVCSEIWPGNTTDVKSLPPLVERLKTRFRMGTVCIVADRGMISAEAVAEAGRAGLYAEVYPTSDDPDDPSPLKVKEVRVEEQWRRSPSFVWGICGQRRTPWLARVLRSDP